MRKKNHINSLHCKPNEQMIGIPTYIQTLNTVLEFSIIACTSI